MIYVLVVFSIVVVLASAAVGDTAVYARSVWAHNLDIHVRAQLPKVQEALRSTLALDVYQHVVGPSHRTGLSTSTNAVTPIGVVPLCDDQAHDPTCTLFLAASVVNTGCSGNSASGGGDSITSTNVDSAAYVADEQRCGMMLRYSVVAANTPPVGGVYSAGQPGVVYTDERRLTYRIFAANPYAVLTGMDRDSDFVPGVNPGVVADSVGNGTEDQAQSYDSSNPSSFSDTMAHGIVAEQHRSGPACNEGMTWGAQNGPGIELDGGCNDSVAAPSPLPNGAYDFPSTDTWQSATSAAAW